MQNQSRGWRSGSGRLSIIIVDMKCLQTDDLYPARYSQEPPLTKKRLRTLPQMFFFPSSYFLPRYLLKKWTGTYPHHILWLWMVFWRVKISIRIRIHRMMILKSERTDWQESPRGICYRLFTSMSSSPGVLSFLRAFSCRFDAGLIQRETRW